MSVYAYICVACDHPLSQHGLVDDAVGVREGPYRCGHCECEIAQDAPRRDLSRQQWERYVVSFPEALRP